MPQVNEVSWLLLGLIFSTLLGTMMIKLSQFKFSFTSSTKTLFEKFYIILLI